jgi:phospholipid/cholesterol/gamma-HCH transport system permease protein
VASQAPSTQYSLATEGGRVRLEGPLRMEDAPKIWRDLCAVEGQAREVDLSGVTELAGNVAALIASSQLQVVGVPEQFAPIVDLYNANEKPPKPKKRKPESMAAQVGRVTLDYVGEVKQVLSFFGEMVLAGGALIRRPRSVHWKEVPPLIEKTGADALPIVALINFLVGFVMAYQAANQLKMFGANIYVADLVGLSATRELAPLMTAIIVCGRSGAAFAAEIGTMKVGEEIDALRTFGLRPFAWIVVPRVIALVVVVPVLSLMADLINIAGGLFVAVTSLDLTVAGYLIETKKAVFGWDVYTGLIKSVVFAIAIALIACQQGFATSGGAEGVGQRTTSTVVKCLFVLVLIDAAFTMIFRAFGV